jgi:glycosyltransferase involved in cell wall biosynthesis
VVRPLSLDELDIGPTRLSTMRVIYATDRRYFESPSGTVWTPTTLPYAFWRQYLTAFDEVRVLARVRRIPEVPAGWQPVDGDRVTIVRLPDFQGPFQYLWRHFRLHSLIRRAVTPGDAVILRVPSHIAMAVSARLTAAKYPYALEVIGDPFDVFSPGATTYPLRGFFQRWFTRGLVRQCRQACAVSYVTANALQRRYPPGEGAYTTHYSSVDLPPEAFVPAPRRFAGKNGSYRLITVGTLAQMYKAPDVLIDAVAICTRQGLDVSLTIVGDGKHRLELEARVKKLRLEGRISFLGQIPAGEPVRRQLDRADLFVLPSHQEGLPRAMVEAMARGCPCIGSDVGGISELLPPSDLVPPGDSTALAAKIRQVLTSPERMELMSRRNLEKAREYRAEVLRERRTLFYAQVKERTERILAGHRPPRKVGSGGLCD